MKAKLTENKPITKALIEEYLRLLKEKGRKESSIGVARRTLYRWYESLPADKLLPEEAMDQWAELLRDKQLEEKTVVNNMAVLNPFLKYLEDPNIIQERGVHKEKKMAAQEHALTQSEYQRLLHTTKVIGHKRTYLLIKAICRLGIRSSEIAELTVDDVQQGELRITRRVHARAIKIYEPVRSDLLAYAAERGIDEGPIFITKDGAPMQHFLIWKEIKKECRRIGLPEDKGTPESLYGTYLETQATFGAETVDDIDKRYLAFLQEEEAVVGWDNIELQQKDSSEASESLPTANIVVRTLGKHLRSEEEDHLAYQIREALPKTLLSQYDCEVTVVFKRKEDAHTKTLP